MGNPTRVRAHKKPAYENPEFPPNRWDPAAQGWVLPENPEGDRTHCSRGSDSKLHFWHHGSLACWNNRKIPRKVVGGQIGQSERQGATVWLRFGNNRDNTAISVNSETPNTMILLISPPRWSKSRAANRMSRSRSRSRKKSLDSWSKPNINSILSWEKVPT